MRNEWKESRLEEITELIVDCPHSTPEWTDNGIIVLRNQNIRNGRLDLTNPSFTNDNGYKFRIKRAVPQANDLVLTREAPMGEICQLPEGLRCCLGQRMVLLRANEERVCSRYLLFVMQGPYLKHQISWNEGTGTTVSNIRIPNIKSFQIPLPPLPEQKAIAHILGSLDDKIELNRKMNETLEAMAQALFKSWFVDFDPVIDNALAAGNEIPEELAERAEQRKALGDKRKKLPPEIQKLFPSEFEFTDELGWMPKGWTIETFQSLITFIVDNRGKTPPLSSSSRIAYPLVEVNALKGDNRFFDKHAIRKYVDINTYNNWFRKGHPREGDVMLSTVGSIAEVCLVDDVECCVAQNIISLRGSTDLCGLYLYELLRHYKDNLINLDISSVQPSIKVPHLMGMKILDGHNLHDKFGYMVKGYSERYKSNQKQLISLSQIRDTLLPKLLSGELRIKDAEKLVEEEL